MLPVPMTSLKRALLLAFTTVLATTFVAEDAHARKRRGRARCKKGERRVEADMPVFGGPGLGYETTHVFNKRTCVRVFRTTPDGTFALVAIDKGRVGWVATGQVEASLSEAEDAKPSDLEEPVERFVVRATPLRATPRFDGKVVVTVPAKTQVKATQGSPDGLWLWVTHKKKSGWLSRYQLVDELPKEGSSPTAGKGAWVVREPELAKPPPAASVAKAREPDEKKGEGAAKGEGEDAAVDGDGSPAAPPSRLLGRGHEIAFGVVIGSWSQRYLSDAYDDPLGRYDLGSTGPALKLSYGFRGQFPVTFDLRFVGGLYGFNMVVPDAQTGEFVNDDVIYTPVFHGGLGLAVGVRLYGDDLVDVETGLGTGGHTIWIADLVDAGGDRLDAFTPGFYWDIARPHVSARTRLGGGEFGMASIEVGVPVGLYAMVYDPGGKWWDNKNDFPVVDQLRPPRAGEDPPVDPNDVEPPILHPFVGVEGSFVYSFRLGESFQLDLGANLGVRQAFIGGPGVRAFGVYTQATNIDVLGGLTLGGTFGF